MAKYRRITFARGSLGRFIKKHGIWMTVLQVPAFMICRKDSHPGERHFILTFWNREGRILKIPYSQGSAIMVDPEITQVLGAIASDVRMFWEFGSAKEFGYAFGFEDDEAEEGFENVKALAKNLDEFLGLDAYNEFMSLATESDDPFEMEGARRCLRLPTCEQ